ncbi:MAG: Panacea domain-containing protein [Candidatus Phytoplasma pruni]|uniref:Panacea domain-containing protein n=1 Tax=Milkweed yellows phytoplasma TaxID=208434 RepID=UPI00036EC9D6|nr:type II toxin-antitoxin system antitoxin SocA domain-containing protein [Milkweed yellows phytoplasma]
MSCKAKTNIFDIVNCIIENNFFPVTKMKMNKMIYYAHDKSLVECNEPLITEEMQAWIYEPVFPALTKVLKKFTYQPIPINTIKCGKASKLTTQQKAIIKCYYPEIR